MIGQKNLHQRIEKLLKNNTFPRFSIFTGPKGSGRKTLVQEVIKSLTDGLYVESGVKVEDIRNLIADAYKVHSLAVYFIPDADNMSNAAKNALLKVTEEPPNNAYFILTLEDENNTLETIRSRASTFHMDRYTPQEIFEFYWTVGEMPNDAELIQQLCQTPGEVLLCVNNVQSFYDYVMLVVDNIAEVSLANAFKVADKVALKDNGEGYDLVLFWKAFIIASFDKKRVSGVDITSRYLQQLRIRGINKQMLFDSWILEIRQAWM